MSAIRIIVGIMLALPPAVMVDIIANSDVRRRPDREELIAIGAVGGWSIVIAALLYFGGFWS